MRISDWSSDVCSSDLDSEGTKPEAQGSKLVPVPNAYGVPMLSTGQIAAAGQAIAWRGPMAGKALEQLIDARWGDIDTLVVDLPPGTGDVQLTDRKSTRLNSSH